QPNVRMKTFLVMVGAPAWALARVTRGAGPRRGRGDRMGASAGACLGGTHDAQGLVQVWVLGSKDQAAACSGVVGHSLADSAGVSSQTSLTCPCGSVV